MPTDLWGTGLGQDWARDMSGRGCGVGTEQKGQVLDHGWWQRLVGRQVSRLWTRGVPKRPAWALSQQASTGGVPAKGSDVLLRRTCPSSSHGGTEGGGREPRNGFSQESLEQVWVRSDGGSL